MPLVVYADFNCPFSALASHRIDRAGLEVDFRAVEHDKELPLDGRAMVGGDRAKLEEEVEHVRSLATADDAGFELRIPEVLPNTETMCAAYASTPTADLRRALFDAVWRAGPATAAEVTTDGSSRHQQWQAAWDAFGDKKIVPLLVLEDGTVSRGLGALKRLAEGRSTEL